MSQSVHVATGAESAATAANSGTGSLQGLSAATLEAAAQLGVQAVDLAGLQVEAGALRLVPRELAQRYELLPLACADEGLRVAVADLLDTRGTDALAHFLELPIVPCLASRAAIFAGIAEHYGRLSEEPARPQPSDAATQTREEESLGAAARTQKPYAARTAIAALEEREGTANGAADDAPITQLVQRLIAEAIERRASDIHLEPLARRFRVRLRIDGALLEVAAPPKRLQAALISRLKLMAGVSIAEKRLPQDGRIQVQSPSGGRPLDLRVSTLPTAHGESIVLRVLDQESLRLGLGELGFMADDRAYFEQLIAAPDGLVLVTGPTGAGKTTTLYSCLHAINKADRKIITVEDPVEYQLSGVNQVPVRAEVGMTFATALRAILRQAPNVVMLGEIRDAETAEIAIHAALTGHLVLSTLHTNDAPSAVSRLVDIGVKPFLVASALRAVLAQRLVRRVCPSCALPHKPSMQELHALGIGEVEARTASLRRGAGCVECHHTGYRGRVGIFELLRVDEPIQQLLHAGASAAKLRAQARERGMRSLREDGLLKVCAGLTTIEEIMATTLGDAQ